MNQLIVRRHFSQPQQYNRDLRIHGGFEARATHQVCEFIEPQPHASQALEILLEPIEFLAQFVTGITLISKSI